MIIRERATQNKVKVSITRMVFSRKKDIYFLSNHRILFAISFVGQIEKQADEEAGRE